MTAVGVKTLALGMASEVREDDCMQRSYRVPRAGATRHEMILHPTFRQRGECANDNPEKNSREPC